MSSLAVLVLSMLSIAWLFQAVSEGQRYAIEIYSIVLLLLDSLVRGFSTVSIVIIICIVALMIRDMFKRASASVKGE